MRTTAIAAILVCACATNNGKLPEGRASYPPPHEDFNKLRPTAIAVMKVVAENRALARDLRREIYDRLFEYNYSCLRLKTIDANTADGVLNKSNVGYDATFEVDISGWKGLRGGRYYAATGEARMIHRHGEVLWMCKFSDYPLEAGFAAGKVDVAPAIKALAAVILKRDQFPRHPEVPPPE